MDIQDPSWELEIIEDKFEAQIRIRDSAGRLIANMSFDSDQLWHFAMSAAAAANWLTACEMRMPRKQFA